MLLIVLRFRGGLWNVHITGGSSQNQLLCQMTADATQRPVIAGPVEATALGNGFYAMDRAGRTRLYSRGMRLGPRFV
jgi:sugar (pentulose or hexulose) kinase